MALVITTWGRGGGRRPRRTGSRARCTRTPIQGYAGLRERSRTRSSRSGRMRGAPGLRYTNVSLRRAPLSRGCRHRSWVRRMLTQMSPPQQRDLDLPSLRRARHPPSAQRQPPPCLSGSILPYTSDLIPTCRATTSSISRPIGMKTSIHIPWIEWIPGGGKRFGALASAIEAQGTAAAPTMRWGRRSTCGHVVIS